MRTTFDSGCALISKRTFIMNEEPYINTFGGFKFDFKPFEGSASIDDPRLGKILFHIKDVICSGNENQYEYILNWLAQIVQGRKCCTALYLVSDGGTGKSISSQECSVYRSQ